MRAWHIVTWVFWQGPNGSGNTGFIISDPLLVFWVGSERACVQRRLGQRGRLVVNEITCR